MNPYIRKVQYYETDMMGVTHHANYIRWMEEARIDYLDQLGFPYREMEANGVMSPVTRVYCEYKHPSTFGDELAISIRVTAFDELLMDLSYEMRNQAGTLVYTGRSTHVFLSKEGHLVRIRRKMPAFWDAMEAQIAKERGD